MATLSLQNQTFSRIERLCGFLRRRLSKNSWRLSDASSCLLGGVKDARAVDRWIAGGEIYGGAEPRSG